MPAPWNADRYTKILQLRQLNYNSLFVLRWLQLGDINAWWQNVSCGCSKCVACRHKAYGTSLVLGVSRASLRKQCERSGPCRVQDKSADCTMNGITIMSSQLIAWMPLHICVLLPCHYVFHSGMSLWTYLSVLSYYQSVAVSITLQGVSLLISSSCVCKQACIFWQMALATRHACWLHHNVQHML